MGVIIKFVQGLFCWPAALADVGNQITNAFAPATTAPTQSSEEKCNQTVATIFIIACVLIALVLAGGAAGWIATKVIQFRTAFGKSSSGTSIDPNMMMAMFGMASGAGGGNPMAMLGGMGGGGGDPMAMMQGMAGGAGGMNPMAMMMGGMMGGQKKKKPSTKELEEAFLKYHQDELNQALDEHFGKSFEAMAVKFLIFVGTNILLSLLLFTMGAWIMALLMDEEYQPNTQERTILSISVMGVMCTLLIISLTSNSKFMYLLDSVSKILLPLELLFYVVLLAFPIVALSIYPQELHVIAFGGSPLWTPFLVLVCVMLAIGLLKITTSIVLFCSRDKKVD